jgi:hypothetical protein
MPYPLVWWAGARIVAYVHYPTISMDMLARVGRRDCTYNNARAISSSVPRTLAKLLYYRAFACVYGFVGMFPDVVMVNSTWTHGHIARLWWRRWQLSAEVVHPPCDVSELEAIPLARSTEQCCLCSIAQFRPEKDHKCATSCYRSWVHPYQQCQNCVIEIAQTFLRILLVRFHTICMKLLRRALTTDRVAGASVWAIYPGWFVVGVQYVERHLPCNRRCCTSVSSHMEDSNCMPQSAVMHQVKDEGCHSQHPDAS